MVIKMPACEGLSMNVAGMWALQLTSVKLSRDIKSIVLTQI